MMPPLQFQQGGVGGASPVRSSRVAAAGVEGAAIVPCPPALLDRPGITQLDHILSDEGWR